MKQRKPIISIKQKCRECGGNPPMPKITMKLGRIENLTKEQRNRVKNIGNKKEGIVVSEFVAECRCKGTGEQEMKITPLRDFEKCVCFNWREKDQKRHYFCSGTGYIIPKEYEPYEIKKVSDILKASENLGFLARPILNAGFFKEHNLKEDDKVVITNA